MEQYLIGYRDKFVIPYLDDLLLFSASFYDHLHRFCLVLHREVNYLERLVSADCFTADHKNMVAVAYKKKQEAKNDF